MGGFTLAAFRPTYICNLAFAHKGFTFNSFSIVFSIILIFNLPTAWEVVES